MFNSYPAYVSVLLAKFADIKLIIIIDFAIVSFSEFHRYHIFRGASKAHYFVKDF